MTMHSIWKLFRLILLFTGIVIIVILCFAAVLYYKRDPRMMSLLYFLGYKNTITVPITILDADTALPISDATVIITKGEGWGGHVSDRKQSDMNGRILIQYEEGFMLGPSFSQVDVVKEGYHPRGLNENDLYGANWNMGVDKLSVKKPPVIRLRKIVNPSKLTRIESVFHKYDQADILSELPFDAQRVFTEHKYVQTGILAQVPLNNAQYPTNVRKYDIATNTVYYDPSMYHRKVDIDFDFAEIHRKETPEQEDRSYAIMRFFGNGGIQEISAANNNDQAYGLQNVIEAPVDGYTKELLLKPGGQYIARLRDGAHYFKFSPDIKKDEKGNPRVKLVLFLQPNLIANLETDVVRNFYLESSVGGLVLYIATGRAGQKQIRLLEIYGDHISYEISRAIDGTTYTSSNERIVTVSADGMATAVGRGRATVTVRNGSFNSIMDVIVVKNDK